MPQFNQQTSDAVDIATLCAKVEALAAQVAQVAQLREALTLAEEYIAECAIDPDDSPTLAVVRKARAVAEGVTG